MATPHTLVYAPQCPNCVRFIGALDRTTARDLVRRVDVNTLTGQDRAHVHAVPMLITNTGTILVGSKAFEWLQQFDTEVESFTLGQGLPYSDFSSDECLITFSSPYSAFEPVP